MAGTKFAFDQKVGYHSKRSSSGGHCRAVPDSGFRFSLLVDEDESAKGTKSPSLSPRHSVSSTSSTGSTTASSSKHKNAGFSKIARLLSQPKEPKISCDKLQSPNLAASDSTSCFSWNRANIAGDRTPLKKSGSIDSLLDSQAAENHGINISISEAIDNPCVDEFASSASHGGMSLKGEMPRCKSGTTIPSSPSSQKVQRSISGACTYNERVSNSSSCLNNKTHAAKRQGSMDFLFPEGIGLNKSERKKLERLNKFNFDVQALFAAVEREQLDRAKTLLESTDLDVNSVNSDGFTALDIAVMTLNISIVKLLQKHGAKEGAAYSYRESREKQLNYLLREAEQSLSDLNGYVLTAATNGSLSAALLKEKERQKMLWERRLAFLQRLKAGFIQLQIPDSLLSVCIEVVGSSSIKAKFLESRTANYREKLVTKYRVEWSRSENFDSISFIEVTDLHKLSVIIDDLTPGCKYYVRAAAGNVKGYSPYRYAEPPYVVPSSWRDIDCKEVRFQKNVLVQLDKLFTEIIDSRPEHSAEVKGLSDFDTPIQQRRGQMRKSIKHLFAPAPKFIKTMKRGVYLTCLFFNEDRILVTTDENLPIVEVDDNYPSFSLNSEFNWIMKVACTWDDVKALRLELEKSQSSSSSLFRSKLLQAIEHLQAALGVQDLGQLYYQPLKDSEGTIALCVVKFVPDFKAVSGLSVRWTPITKFQKKASTSSSSENSDSSANTSNVGELLLSSLQDIILYNKASRHPLQRGLYLGYVKLKSSVDVIGVVVPRLIPNVLPHIRIRENPHVSESEWQSLKSFVLETKTIETDAVALQSQSKFLHSLSQAFRHLSITLELSEKEISSHRLYDIEVIELNNDVSFILLLPPIESVCLVPGQRDALTDNQNFIHLPVQIFEMAPINRRSSRDIHESHQYLKWTRWSHNTLKERQAFSANEMSAAKDRITQLQEFQSKLDYIWKPMRWMMDVINYARDKQTNYGVPLSTISANFPSNEDLNDEPDSPKMLIPSIYLQPVQPLQPPKLEAAGYVPQRRPSRDDSTIGLSSNNFLNQLRIVSSVSTYSLLDVIHTNGNLSVDCTLSEPSEMRRCVSTSKLAHGTAPNSVDNSDRDELDESQSEEKKHSYSRGNSLDISVDEFQMCESLPITITSDESENVIDPGS
ncbi:ankyrin repeat and fibronectin type-III domain-containing protein 1-like protein, partial [Dinothrombium tinctorium]